MCAKVENISLCLFAGHFPKKPYPIASTLVQVSISNNLASSLVSGKAIFFDF